MKEELRTMFMSGASLGAAGVGRHCDEKPIWIVWLGRNFRIGKAAQGSREDSNRAHKVGTDLYVPYNTFVGHDAPAM